MIGFLDSGIGGVFVLKKFLELYPNNKIIYLADNKNIPFGNKSKKKLIKIAISDCKMLVEKNCDIIVFACNTLTAAAIDACRKIFPNLTFVGIEPAIIPASKTPGKSLVLLTNATFKYSKLIRKHRRDKNLEFSPQKNLAKDIELGRVKNLKKYFKNKNFSSVVLGCTHYNLLKNEISSYLNVNNFFEASVGVARRIGLFANNNEKQKVSFLFTGKNESVKYRCFLKNKKSPK